MLVNAALNENTRAAKTDLALVRKRRIDAGGNGFFLAARLTTPPVPGNTFYIMRYATQRVDDTGSQIVIAQPGPTQYVLDGNDVEVTEDTFDASNNKPLPTKSFDSNNFPINPATQETLEFVGQEVQFIDQKLPANLGQKASADSLAVVLSTEQEAEIGAKNETAPASDTASSGLNGRLQRIAQRLSSLIALLPASIGQKAMAGSLSVTIASDQATFPVTTGGLTDAQLRATPVSISGTVTANAGTNLNTSALALETTQVANGVLIGAVNETAPASDTASSGLNGRLQRIAQRLTSLIALVPASLGQKAMSGSFAVTLASDQSAIATKAPVNTNGSGGAQTALTGTTASSEAAPANAVGFILQADPANTDPIRFRIGGTASAVNGVQLESSRDSGYIPCAATVSICATNSGTNKYCIQWILSV